jgi:hypothetical protein
MRKTERIDFVSGKLRVTTTSMVIARNSCAAVRHSLA